MRYAFVQQLTRLAAKNKNIILLTADLGFTVFEEFAKKFPKQFFNVGIAEPNMIGVAAGLALSGKTVFAYSIASFATFRTYEYIRNDVCLHKAPVIVVGSGAGLSYADNGPTHLATQDLALMRTLPNMTILAPADPVEVQWATREAVRLKSPVYLRLGKKGEPIIYDKAPKLVLGQGSWVKKGPDFVLLVCGNMVFNALKSAEILEKKGFSGAVISIHTVKPIDKKLIVQLAKNYSHIVTVEEHSVIGGLGSGVSEIISQILGRKPELLILGIKDDFPKKLGSQEYLRKIYSLTAEKLSLRIAKFLKKS